MGLYRLLAMVAALILLAVEGVTSIGVAAALSELLAASAIRDPLLQVLLALFLFGVALQVRGDGGAWLRGRLILLSLLVIVFSMLLTALLGGWVISKIGVDLAMIHYLLIGLMLAPTDPLAIARLMGFAGATPAGIGRAAGEAAWGSLFVLLLYLWLTGALDAGSGAGFFAMVQFGGASLLLGLLAGAVLLFAFVRSATTGGRLALSVAMILAVSALAIVTGLSAPIAALVTGLAVIQCPSRWSPAMADIETVYGQLSPAWSRLVEVIVAVLLLWLGIELAAASPSLMLVTVAVFLVPVIVIARVAAVYAMVYMLDLREQFTSESVRVMVWGGVRSALAAALVLMLEPGTQTTMMLTTAFLVLMFSTLVQGPLYSITAAIARPIAKEAEAAEVEARAEAERAAASADDEIDGDGSAGPRG